MRKQKELIYSRIFFETRDIAEASILKAFGTKYIGTKTKEQDLWFIYDDKERCEEIINTYLNGGFPEIESFVNAQREIKKIIINFKKKNGN